MDRISLPQLFAGSLIATLIIYLFSPLLAIVFLLSAFYIFLSFSNLKLAFYIFLFTLPLSFNIPLNLGGLKDIFVADGMFFILFGVFMLNRIMRNDLRIKTSLLTSTVIAFVAVSLISILTASMRIDGNELYRINSILHIRYARLNPLTVSPVSMANFFVFFRTFFPLFLYYFVYETFSSEQKEIKTLLKVILLSGIAVSVFGWLSKFNLIPDVIYSIYHIGNYVQSSLLRIPSTFDNPQSFGTFLALCLAVIYYYITERPGQLAFYFTGAFMFGIFILTYSFGSYAALIGALFIITILSRKMSASARSAVLLFTAAAFILIILNNEFIQEKIRISTTIVNPRRQFPGTIQTRIIKWGRWWRILQPNLFLGLGYPTVWQDNNYIKMLVNAGIPGFITYYSIVGVMLYRGIKLYLKNKGDSLSLIFIVSGVIFMIHSLSYDVSIVFKVNAYFFIFAALVSRRLNDSDSF